MSMQRINSEYTSYQKTINSGYVGHCEAVANLDAKDNFLKGNK